MPNRVLEVEALGVELARLVNEDRIGILVRLPCDRWLSYLYWTFCARGTRVIVKDDMVVVSTSLDSDGDAVAETTTLTAPLNGLSGGIEWDNLEWVGLAAGETAMPPIDLSTVDRA